METRDDPVLQEVINQATHCATAYYGMYDTTGQEQRNSEPTRVVDMATTGGIPEGYTHLIFIAMNTTGYVVSRNLEGQYKVEIHNQITS